MLTNAWRSVVRAPIVSSVIVLSLSAGIGVNTVVFSWMQSRMLNPLPAVTDGARIHWIETRNANGGYPASSWPEYEDLRERLRLFDDLIAFRMTPLYIGERAEVERVFGLLVSGNYFDALGVQPAAGRFFTDTPADARAPAVVISHALWQEQFGGRSDVAGQRTRINGADVSILGVAPADFKGTVLGLAFDVWLPATSGPLILGAMPELDDRAVRAYSLMGHLGDGVDRAQAQAEVTAVMSALASAYPETNAGLTAEVLTFWDSPRGPNRLLNTALFTLQALMLLLLAAVCGNTANLVLARASARQREIGVRLALGAGRSRIASLLIAENVMLGLLGAAGGALIALWGTDALKVIPMTGLPVRLETRIDLVSLAFATLLGVVSGALVGAVPALHLARLSPAVAFRHGARTAARSRMRDTLMAAQVALAVLVLIAAGLVVRSFLATRSEDTGFRREGVLLTAYDLEGRDTGANASRQFAARLLDRVNALPGVHRAAIATSVPLDIHGLPLRSFTVEGRPRETEGRDEGLINTVTPGYFETMGIAIVEGSDFAPLTDAFAAPQVIVNRAFVRRYIGEGSAVGRRLRTRDVDFAIAGVVADSLYNAFGEPPTPAVYFSYRDRPAASGEIHLWMREGSEAQLARAVREAVRELDPDLPVFNTRTIEQHIASNLVFRRVPARMFAFLGPMLLLLAAVGIYATVAYSMSLRRAEIGVRLALGASAGRVVRDYLAATMTIVAAGAAPGWLLAFVIGVQALGQGSLDLTVYAGVPALLLAVAACAAWIPAHRASRLDPWHALR